MTEPGISETSLPKKKRKRWWKYLLFVLLFLIAGTYLFLFFGFNYFGTRLLRGYLQEKVVVASQGLYRADFREIHLNIITGRVTIDSLEIIPDSARYEQLKAAGKIKKSLYRFSLASLTINRLHAWQIFRLHRVNLRQLIMNRPVVSIVGFPDTATARRGRIKIIYEDIYPSIAEVFNDFHVDSITMDHGLFLSSFRQKTGTLSEGEYEFSAILRDVSVNPFSYFNRKRVFYSRDIEWVIYHFEYVLADSLYFLKAEEAGFSLSGSHLYGKKLSLRPNFRSSHWRKMKTGDFFALDLPAFSIDGINMYHALVEKSVNIGKLELSDLMFKVYHNKLESDTTRFKKSRKKQISAASLYTIIAGVLRSVAIDTIKLNHATFEYYGKTMDRYPELRIGGVDLQLTDFFLDSLAWKDQKKIFFANELELKMKNFSLRLQDGIHTLDAGQVNISTRRSEIRLLDGLISPNISKNLLLKEGGKNTISLILPELVFHKINLKNLFNHRIFDFEELDIYEPDVKATRFREPRNKDPRFKKPGDFFEPANESVVYDLLKKYVWRIKGEKISILHGHGQMARNEGGIEKKIAAASFDLQMEQILIDSVHGMNQEGYFYSRDFDLNLQSVFLESPDSMRRLQANRIHIATRDSLIETDNLSLFESSRPNNQDLRVSKRTNVTLEFNLKKLHLSGLNHKRLFRDKMLKATQIIIETPVLKLKSEANPQPEGPLEESQQLTTDNMIRDMEVGRLIVRKGAFSYDGQEDRKTSYFSLKDIDFSIVGSKIHIPRQGVHDGLIRFDSLHLSVFPFRAILADSTYALEILNLGVLSYPANIVAIGLKVIPLTPSTTNQEQNSLVTIKIPELRINGFYFDRALFDHEWVINKIVMEEPSFLIEMKQPEKIKEVSKEPSTGFSFTVPPFIKVLDIRSIVVNKALTNLKIQSPKEKQQYRLADLDIKVTRLLFDSANRIFPSRSPLFNARDISMQAPGMTWISTDSMYSFSFRRFGLSTQEKKGFIDSISVIPNYSRVDFSRKSGYQTDRIILSVPRLDLGRIDFQKAMNEQQFKAGNVHISGLKIEAYRDKRVPFPTWQRPPLPQSMIRKIKVPLQIDTVFFQDGFASYEEQTDEEPGMIFFDRINGSLTGLNTRKTGKPVPFELHSTLALMGKAPSEAWFHFFMDHPRDSFTLRASIGSLGLKELNPMLSRILPVSVASGVADSTEIKGLFANDSIANGLLQFYFRDLSIRLEPNPGGIKSSFERKLMTTLIDLILPDQNPKEDGTFRTGTIYFERDMSKGFLNFVWKSIFSGLKSSAGINTKKQKEIRREVKKKQK